MRDRILKLFTTFLVLFSLQSYSQTTEASKHPLLDKYYPRAEDDTTATIVTKPAPVVNQVSGIKPAAITPITSTSPVPAVTDTIAAIKPTNTAVPLPETKLISKTIPATSVTDTTTDIRPINTAVTLTIPVQTKIEPKPPTTPYVDTRLGSSTPAYDTWEKNNNGAGSVTTSPK